MLLEAVGMQYHGRRPRSAPAQTSASGRLPSQRSAGGDRATSHAGMSARAPWQPRYKRRGTSTRIITQGWAGLKYPCASCQIDDAGVQALLSAYVAVVASLGVPCFTR